MSKFPKKPRKSLFNGTPLTLVIGDNPLNSAGISRNRGSLTQKLAARRRKNPTIAERALEYFLNTLKNGILRGKFIREWAFAGKWILDFFFYENRLAIEVDGSFHSSPQQKKRDLEKERACENFGITLIRISNYEVFSDREALLRKLKEGYRKANDRQLQIKKRENHNSG
jgi:very-short-patch-repair endonuclease